MQYGPQRLSKGWTDFEEDDHTTLVASLRTEHGRCMLSSHTQDEDFINRAAQWTPNEKAGARKRNAAAADKLNWFKRVKKR